MTTPRSTTVELPSLLAALDGARVVGDATGAVDTIVCDSRSVKPGSLFVALRGSRVDGHEFLAQAVTNGARAVVVDERFAATHEIPERAAAVVVLDTRPALSRLAAAYHGFPSRALRVAGVTGTNGKTTTTQLAAAMLREAGIAAGFIGTLGARFGGAMWSLDNTTPLALELQALLAEMRDRGAAAVTMEVSSHALALDRVADVEFAAAALTNVTRDHLDFHGDLDSYAAAKRKLFDQTQLAIFNADDPYGVRWAAQMHGSDRPAVVTYALHEGADVVAGDLDVRADGSAFRVGALALRSHLPGRFNVSNALAALCLARGLGASDEACARALASFAGVPGRMEHLAGGSIDVLVDYAHTPDALEAVLQAAREAARGNMIVVFGCGGDRDRGKRPLMGRIAARLADRVVVTSDNPRTEDPQAIVDEVVAGAHGARNVSAVVDRRAAIRAAIADASPGDVVVVAGKGHETYQIVGERTQHFDDRDEVRAALAAREDVRA